METPDVGLVPGAGLAVDHEVALVLELAEHPFGYDVGDVPERKGAGPVTLVYPEQFILETVEGVKPRHYNTLLFLRWRGLIQAIGLH